jgi:hypothetical protein
MVREEPNYKHDVTNKGRICRKGKRISQINPQVIPFNSVTVKPRKLVNVNKLLTKHFGVTIRAYLKDFRI